MGDTAIFGGKSISKLDRTVVGPLLTI